MSVCVDRADMFAGSPRLGVEGAKWAAVGEGREYGPSLAMCPPPPMAPKGKHKEIRDLETDGTQRPRPRDISNTRDGVVNFMKLA